MVHSLRQRLSDPRTRHVPACQAPGHSAAGHCTPDAKGSYTAWDPTSSGGGGGEKASMARGLCPGRRGLRPRALGVVLGGERGSGETEVPQGRRGPGGSHTGGGYDNLPPPWHARARSQGGHVLLSTW